MQSEAKSWRDTDDAQTRGLPLMPGVARRMAAELFAERELWSKQELIEAVTRIHRDRGGVDGIQPAPDTIKKALQYLQEDGVIERTTAKGIWRRKEPRAATEGELAAPEEGPAEAVPSEVPEGPAVRTIGGGAECVYLYYSPNDRRLAELEGRATWECKVGRSTSPDPWERIVAQGSRTALSHPPVVGLVILTDDSSALEKALHASLRLTENEVADSLGVEWFLTSPERVEGWYRSYQHACQALEGLQGEVRMTRPPS